MIRGRRRCLLRCRRPRPSWRVDPPALKETLRAPSARSEESLLRYRLDGSCSRWLARQDGQFRSVPARVSGRGLEAIRLHYVGRVDECEDGQDDVLGERSPGRAKACEAGVNRCQIVAIGAWVALLRRCQREG
jgi:hypothetical protein